MKHAIKLTSETFDQAATFNPKQPISLNLSDQQLTSFQDEGLCYMYRLTHNPEIVGELFKRHSHKVLGSCFNLLKNQDDAQDACMEIFEKLFEKLKDSEVSNFPGWLFMVTRNHCLGSLRKKGRNIIHLWDERSPEAIGDTGSDEDLIRREFWTAFENALATLCPGQQDCIIRFYILKQRYKEIAEKTSYSEKQVKSYLQNGMKGLRKLVGSQAWRENYSPLG